jgi:hypothetical protein
MTRVQYRIVHHLTREDQLMRRLIALVTAAFAVSACSAPTSPSTEAAKAKAALDAAAKAPTKASPRLATN